MYIDFIIDINDNDYWNIETEIIIIDHTCINILDCIGKW